MLTHDAQLSVSYLGVFRGQRRIIVFFVGALTYLASAKTASFVLSSGDVGASL
jgi:hypothetical protein